MHLLTSTTGRQYCYCVVKGSIERRNGFSDEIRYWVLHYRTGCNVVFVLLTPTAVAGGITTSLLSNVSAEDDGCIQKWQIDEMDNTDIPLAMPEHLRIREEEQQVAREPVASIVFPTVTKGIIKQDCFGDDELGLHQSFFVVSSHKAPNIREDGIPNVASRPVTSQYVRELNFYEKERYVQSLMYGKLIMARIAEACSTWRKEHGQNCFRIAKPFDTDTDMADPFYLDEIKQASIVEGNNPAVWYPDLDGELCSPSGMVESLRGEVNKLSSCSSSEEMDSINQKHLTTLKAMVNYDQEVNWKNSKPPQPFHNRVWDETHLLDFEPILASDEYHQTGNLPLVRGMDADLYDPENPETMDHIDENAILMRHFTQTSKIWTKNEMETIHNQKHRSAKTWWAAPSIGSPTIFVRDDTDRQVPAPAQGMLVYQRNMPEDWYSVPLEEYGYKCEKTRITMNQHEGPASQIALS